jgi:yeast amino acid transporter
LLRPLQWAINLAAEYNLIAIVLSYWTDKVPSYGWILIFWAFYQCIGFLGIVVYGEAEFWLATIKIACIGVTFILSEHTAWALLFVTTLIAR